MQCLSCFGAAKMAENGVGGVFHERQRQQLCLLHALNNLLQGERAFSRRELDGIADSLPLLTIDTRWSPLRMIYKPHRNALFGDYDVNVLLAALPTRGKDVIWYNKEQGPRGADCLNSIATYGRRFFGLIVNFPTSRCAGMLKGRHWAALRMVSGQWYNLDSDFAEPLAMNNGEDDLKRYLDSILDNDGAVLIVVDEDVTGSSS